MGVGEVWLLPGGWEDVSTAVGVQKVVQPYPQKGVVADHCQGRTPELETEEGASTLRVQEGGETWQSEQWDCGQPGHDHHSHGCPQPPSSCQNPYRQ